MDEEALSLKIGKAGLIVGAVSLLTFVDSKVGVSAVFFALLAMNQKGKENAPPPTLVSRAKSTLFGPKPDAKSDALKVVQDCIEGGAAMFDGLVAKK